jgi:hypothetical protein
MIRSVSLNKGFVACAILGCGFPANAATVTFDFSGQTSAQMEGLAAGTPFTGTFIYNDSVNGTTTPYYSGTETIFADAYSTLTMTIDGRTVAETVPGTISMFNNVNPPNTIPVGSTLYSFSALSDTGANPSTGSFNGLTPNSIGLGFYSSGKVFGNSTSLPSMLNSDSFNEAFIGVNYGPFGTGNADTISMLSGTSVITGVPEPNSFALMAPAAAVFGTVILRRRCRPGAEAHSLGNSSEGESNMDTLRILAMACGGSMMKPCADRIIVCRVGRDRTTTRGFSVR